MSAVASSAPGECGAAPCLARLHGASKGRAPLARAAFAAVRLLTAHRGRVPRTSLPAPTPPHPGAAAAVAALASTEAHAAAVVSTSGGATAAAGEAAAAELCYTL